MIDQDDLEEINEELSPEEETAAVHYDITSYGIDFDVEGLVKRLDRATIMVPEFQRKYVWNQPEASRFIESLLLGLPVPGIFLAQDSDSGKMYVIDGQQRLLSLQYFYKGEFKPRADASSKRIFKLLGVQPPYNNATFETLTEADRENLNNCVIHATVVKQDSPDDGDTSMYHIFGRLNSGGRRLTPQEIRTAVYHGNLIETLKRTNLHASWRKVFGAENDRMKDQELILRFFAMLETSNQYKKPMSEFLSKYAKANQKAPQSKLDSLASEFTGVIDSFVEAIPLKQLFRPVRGFNVAAFESCTVGLAKARRAGVTHTPQRLSELYAELFTHGEFKDFIFASTSDVQITADRLKIASDVFSKN